MDIKQYYSVNSEVSDNDPLISDQADLETPFQQHAQQVVIVKEVSPQHDAEIPSVWLSDTSVASEESQPKQHSFITVFAIWNTMMGTSILSMPWAIQQAGLVCGILLMIIMAGICLYTAYRVIQVQSILGIPNLRAEYSDICRFLLGCWAEWLSSFFSILSLLGAMIVYWILMSNFLFNSVKFIMDATQHHIVSNNSSNFDVICVIKQDKNSTIPSDDGNYLPEWNLTLTPLYLIILVFPLINFRSPTFFTKFNALGIVSAVFIMVFAVVKAFKWGLNVDFSQPKAGDYIPLFHWNFPELSGTLALAYFIHNCITSVIRNNRNPENNVRDLSIAYCLVAATYMLVGMTFYLSFPLQKDCIADNLLNNLTNWDPLSFAARLFLLFQMLTVFPLLVYIVRVQFYAQVFNLRIPKLKHILPLNIVLVGIATLFAIFYPHIGQMARYTGAICGLAYSFALPCLTFLEAQRWRGQLTYKSIVVHVTIIVIGVANFVAQFFVSGN